MHVALIAIDLDGTLFDHTQRVPEANAAALLEAQACGIHIALSSGRLHNSVLSVARDIGLSGPIISSNGALARDREGGVCFDRPLNARSLRQCMEYLDANEAYYILFSGDTIYPSLNTPHIDNPGAWDSYLAEGGLIKVKKLHSVNSLGDAVSHVHKIAAVDSRPHALRALRAGVERIEGIEVNSAWHDNIEIMDAGVSKGAALTALATYLGVPMEHVMAIGDNENDITMLKAAGVSVAMGNALDSVKAICKHTTLSNNEAGVAHAVRAFALEV